MDSWPSLADSTLSIMEEQTCKATVRAEGLWSTAASSGPRHKTEQLPERYLTTQDPPG